MTIYILNRKRKSKLKNDNEKWESKTKLKIDLYKQNLALINGIENYIIIDCSKSDLDYIKPNILKSKLNEMFDLNNINVHEQVLLVFHNFYFYVGYEILFQINLIICDFFRFLVKIFFAK